MSDDPFESLNETDDETPVIAVTPRASGAGGDTLKAQALAGLPAQWRERLIADAGAAGVKHDNDVGWLLVGSVVHAASAAFAAGESAQAVQAGVSEIPDQIFKGAVRAGDEVSGALGARVLQVAEASEQKLLEGGKGLVVALAGGIKESLGAATAAASEISKAAETLQAGLDKSIETKKKEGIDKWAGEVAATIQATAQRAGDQFIRNSKRDSWVKIMVVGGLMGLLWAGIGGAVVWKYLDLVHQIAPAPIMLTVDGKLNCGQASIKGIGKQQVCVLTPGQRGLK